MNNRSLLSMLSTSKEDVGQLAILATTKSVTFMLTVYFIKYLIQSATENEKGKLIQMIFFFFFCYLFNMLSTYMLNRLKITKKNNAERSVKGKIYFKLQQASLSKLRTFASGDLLTRYTDIVEHIIKYIFEDLINFISNIVLLALVTIYVAINNIMLLLTLCVILPVMLLVNYSGRKSADYFKQSQAQMSQCNIAFRDIVKNVDEINAAKAHRFFLSKFSSIAKTLMKTKNRMAYFDTITWITGVASYQIIYILLYVIGAILAFRGTILFSTVVSLFILIDPLISIIQSIPNFVLSTKKVMQSKSTIDEILDMRTSKGNYMEKDAHCKFSIVNLKYAYPMHCDTPVLRGVDLQFQSNEKILIFGESGSGKSSLCQLLFKFDDKYSGDIFVNDMSLTDVDISSIGAYLPQEIELIDDTVYNNFVYSLGKEASIEIMRTMLELTEIIEEIDEMPERFNTNVYSFSVGQRQRIAIAMMLAKRKNILVLDESFSALNIDLSIRIINRLASLDCGLMVICHTVNREMINAFDRVLVFSDGQIVYDGRDIERIDSLSVQRLFGGAQCDF